MKKMKKMTSIDKFSNKSEQSLKTLAVKGSVHLTIRRTISIALNVLGALLITRIVGPEVYGLYNAAYGIFAFLLPVALMGMNVYLIRETNIPTETIDAIFWWILFFSFFYSNRFVAFIYDCCQTLDRRGQAFFLNSNFSCLHSTHRVKLCTNGYYGAKI